MTKRSTQPWSIRQLVNLSRNMARPFGVDLNANSEKPADEWTTQRFIDMSRALGRAYQAE